MQDYLMHLVANSQIKHFVELPLLLLVIGYSNVISAQDKPQIRLVLQLTIDAQKIHHLVHPVDIATILAALYRYVAAQLSAGIAVERSAAVETACTTDSNAIN